jgi:hypothetical protein
MRRPPEDVRSPAARTGPSARASLAIGPLALFASAIPMLAAILAAGTSPVSPAAAPAAIAAGSPSWAAFGLLDNRAPWGGAAA